MQLDNVCEEFGYGVYCTLSYQNAGQFVLQNDDYHVIYVMPWCVTFRPTATKEG